MSVQVCPLFAVDNSYSVRVYLKISFNKSTIYGVDKYLLTNVRGNWTILDSNDYVNSAYLAYGCSDITISQQDFLYVNNNYSRSTGFTSYITDVGGILGQYLQLSLGYTGAMGATRTWTFKLENFLFNNNVDLEF